MGTVSHNVCPPDFVHVRSSDHYRCAWGCSSARRLQPSYPPDRSVDGKEESYFRLCAGIVQRALAQTRRLASLAAMV